MPVYDLYSKRKKRAEMAGQPDVYKYDSLPQSLRIQITKIWDDAIGPYVDYDPYITSRSPRNANENGGAIIPHLSLQKIMMNVRNWLWSGHPRGNMDSSPSSDARAHAPINVRVDAATEFEITKEHGRSANNTDSGPTIRPRFLEVILGGCRPVILSAHPGNPHSGDEQIKTVSGPRFEPAIRGCPVFGSDSSADVL